MFGFLLDMVQGMRCPACRKRGLFAVASRAIREGELHQLRVNPRWALARCRRCSARCIKQRYADEAYRLATDEEWRQHAYEEIPPARIH